VSDVSDEYASRMLATCPQQDEDEVVLVDFGERHDTRTNGQHYTPQQTAGRPIRYERGKLNGEVARHARHARHLHSIRAMMLRVLGVSTRILQGCYEETAAVEFKLNSEKGAIPKFVRFAS